MSPSRGPILIIPFMFPSQGWAQSLICSRRLIGVCWVNSESEWLQSAVTRWEPWPDSYRLKNPGLPKGLSWLSTEGGGGGHSRCRLYRSVDLLQQNQHIMAFFYWSVLRVSFSTLWDGITITIIWASKDLDRRTDESAFSPPEILNLLITGSGRSSKRNPAE